MPSYNHTKKRFLAPAQLQEAAEQVVSLAAAENTRVALCGGYALQLYGSDRLTGDVDFITEALLDALPPGPQLSFGGIQTEAPNGVEIDLILRDDSYRELYEAALTHSVIHEDGLPIVSPAFLAAIKMAAGRPRDMLDLDWLIVDGGLNVDNVRHVVRKYLGVYAVQEFDRIADVAIWNASREKKLK